MHVWWYLLIVVQLWCFAPAVSERRAARSIILPDTCDGLHHDCDQLCTRIHDNYICGCDQGYRLAPDSRTCADVDECSDYGPCEQSCLNTEGKFVCTCHAGYQINDDLRTCTDIDECSSPEACSTDGHNRTCINLPGTFQCMDTPSIADTEIMGPISEAELPDLNTTAKIDDRQKGKAVVPKCDVGESTKENSGISSGDLAVLSGCFIAIIGLLTTFVIIFAVASCRRRAHKPSLFASPATTTSSVSTSSLSSELSPKLRRVWPRRQLYVKRPHRRPGYVPTRLDMQHERNNDERKPAGPDVTGSPSNRDSKHGNTQCCELVSEFI